VLAADLLADAMKLAVADDCSGPNPKSHQNAEDVNAPADGNTANANGGIAIVGPVNKSTVTIQNNKSN
jgi:hypothetical protein